MGEVAYGQLPTAFYETIRTRWLAAYDAGKVTQVEAYLLTSIGRARICHAARIIATSE